MLGMPTFKRFCQIERVDAYLTIFYKDFKNVNLQKDFFL